MVGMDDGMSELVTLEEWRAIKGFDNYSVS